ncbi:MAG TPA: hypothetical protein VK503_08060 [Candidatus Bathyarchaeia archaeon]|nr:hypothetical protein [Candidatus Bathyarchaeia archaeon]
MTLLPLWLTYSPKAGSACRFRCGWHERLVACYSIATCFWKNISADLNLFERNQPSIRILVDILNDVHVDSAGTCPLNVGSRPYRKAVNG